MTSNPFGVNNSTYDMETTSSNIQDDPLFNPQWEEQLMLRVPPTVAELIKKKSPDLEFQWRDERNGTLIVAGERFPMTLIDLPCVTETHKTIDNVTFYKTGDIGQMILVSTPESYENDKKQYDKNYKKFSGLTPPTHQIQKRLWPKKCNVSLKRAENEVMRRGLSDDIELQWVTPDEVADVGDYYEETHRVDSPSTPYSPYTNTPGGGAATPGSPYSGSKRASQSPFSPPLSPVHPAKVQKTEPDSDVTKAKKPRRSSKKSAEPGQEGEKPKRRRKSAAAATTADGTAPEKPKRKRKSTPAATTTTGDATGNPTTATGASPKKAVTPRKRAPKKPTATPAPATASAPIPAPISPAVPLNVPTFPSRPVDTTLPLPVGNNNMSSAFNMNVNNGAFGNNTSAFGNNAFNNNNFNRPPITTPMVPMPMSMPNRNQPVPLPVPSTASTFRPSMPTAPVVPPVNQLDPRLEACKARQAALQKELATLKVGLQQQEMKVQSTSNVIIRGRFQQMVDQVKTQVLAKEAELDKVNQEIASLS